MRDYYFNLSMIQESMVLVLVKKLAPIKNTVCGSASNGTEYTFSYICCSASSGVPLTLNSKI